ncbi:MAG: hypothetical protein UY48_C0018G0003 [Candidatus Gottesmanbacteria bacterium GW2011_GWB1_49_7]|uniref:Uncharacterized protein n=1 Tax=Candidatus Gottesmanbacteria bacterium GW2011_GWB1_49_7 TaxID=1618448 RepID=A0A0G1YYM7_9BACT|nr:MAG: hypothetical protein UY48_C0018G0003 [Candidatus Gottesmanbacteria bacterium GW2011_GWB1_49_7]
MEAKKTGKADTSGLRCSICLRWLAYILTAGGEIPVGWIICRQCVIERELFLALDGGDLPLEITQRL